MNFYRFFGISVALCAFAGAADAAYTPYRSRAPQPYASAKSAGSSNGLYAAFYGTGGMAPLDVNYSFQVDRGGSLGTEYGDPDNFKATPYGISAAFGFYNDEFRGEAEFNYYSPFNKSVNIDDAGIPVGVETFHYGNWSVMFNGYYDVGDKTWIARPYVGVGVGLNIATIKHGLNLDTTVDSTAWHASINNRAYQTDSLSAQLMAGVQARLSGDGMYLDLGYKGVLNGNADVQEVIRWSNTTNTYSGAANTIVKPGMGHFFRIGLRMNL
ncbi:MAG: hypothetical protein LBB23_00115 [Rickettsiales bacterium]|jgi:hypothetical protein|nr:hypothetical protein [Rickettsiales bacterium]